MYDDLFGPGPGSVDNIATTNEKSDHPTVSQEPQNENMRDLAVPFPIGNYGGLPDYNSPMGENNNIDCYKDPLSRSFNFPCEDPLKSGKLQIGSNLRESANAHQSDSLYLALEEKYSFSSIHGATIANTTAISPPFEDTVSQRMSSTGLHFGGESKFKDGRTELAVGLSVSRELALSASAQASTNTTLELGHKENASNQEPRGAGKETKLLISHNSDEGWAGGVVFEWKF